MTGDKEPDVIPDVIPDVTPDTPADEAPVVPNEPKEDTPVPQPESNVEAKLDTLISGMADLTNALLKNAVDQVADETPVSRPWTHKGFGRRRD